MGRTATTSLGGELPGPHVACGMACLLAMVVALSSCAFEMDQMEGPSSGLDDDPRAQMLEPGEYVLVYRDAAFYEVRGDEDRAHRGFQRDRQAAAEPSVPRLVARVVEDHGEWVEVERTPPSESSVCGSRELAQEAPVRLQYYVAREDLALAVRRSVSRRYDDGTGVDLLPGVPVERVSGGQNQYRIWHGGLNFDIELSSESVGIGFSPGEPWEVASSGAIVELDREDARMNAGVEVSGYTRFADEVGTHDGRTLFEIRRQCAQVTVSVPPSESRSHGGTAYCNIGGMASGVSSRPDYVVEPGTPVYWPEGGEAGEVTEEIEIGAPSSGEQRRYCWTTLLLDGNFAPNAPRSTEEERVVEYCVDDADLSPTGEPEGQGVRIE